MRQSRNIFLTMLISLFLVACGGGGSLDGDTGGTDGEDGEAVVVAKVISLAMTDLDGNVLTAPKISSAAPGRIVATVTGITASEIVTFSSDLGSIPITTAITNGSYVATADIFASNSLGAGTITASLASGEVSSGLVFSIGASKLGIGSAILSGQSLPDNVIDTPAGDLSAGGTATLAVTIWDTSVTPPIPYADAVDINFASDCASLTTPTATLDTVVTTINGVATSTYLAKGCEGEDTITATVTTGGAVLSATGIVKVLPANVGSIEFVSSAPQNITLKGVGGIESSTVIFRVLDIFSNPVANKNVVFSLNTEVGGLAISSITATSNALGLVQTTVNSGTVHTSVRVTAKLVEPDGSDSNPLIASQSSSLVVSTGIADQDSFSLSASTLNPEGWNLDGTEVTITARLADAFNNPVQDGTTVSFTTEGGSIEPSCQTANGVCNVTWRSQNSRPSGKTLIGESQAPQVFNTMGQKYGGRATIVATAIGEESFPDINGNGRFDAVEMDRFIGRNSFDGLDVNGHPFDRAEAFVDHNEDGVFNDNAGAQAGGDLEVPIHFANYSTYDGADGLYNGSLCGDTPANCSATKSINVSGSLVLVMSGSNPLIVTTWPTGNAPINISSDGTGAASVIIADLHNQPMPAGTTVSFNAAVGSIVGTSSFIWPSDNHNGGTAFGVTVKGVKDESLSGPLTVVVTTPGNDNTSSLITTLFVATINITP